MTRIALRDGHVDLDRGEVVRGSARSHLTTAEAALLGYLAQHPNRDVPRDELHQHVWGHAASTSSRAADYAVMRLRRKIEQHPAEPEVVLTVHGVGYRYVPVPPLGLARPPGPIALVVAMPVDVHGDAAAQQRWLEAAASAGRVPGADVITAAPDRIVVASSPSEAVAVAGVLHGAVRARIGVASGEAEPLVDPVSGRTLYGGAVHQRAVVAAWRAAPGATADAEADPHGTAALPERPGTFVGRSRELRAVLEASGAVIVGPPGVGKSRLLEAAARALCRGGAFPGGAALARVGEAGDAEAAVREAIGVDGVGDPVDALAVRPPTLLVVDDAEAAPQRVARLIERLARQAPAVRVLVGSRHALPVPLVEIALGPLSDEASVALLRDRGVLGTNDALVALARRYDGLPLALELVAGLLRGSEPPETDARTETPAMDRALAGSWDRLERWERQVLAQAALFAGPFDLRDAEAVCAADSGEAWAVDVVLGLADKHLLERTDAGGTRRAFGLLATVRDFAARRGRDDPSLMGDAVRRYVLHVAGFASRAAPAAVHGLRGTLLGDGLAATRHALAAGWGEQAARCWVVAATVAAQIGALDAVDALYEPVAAASPEGRVRAGVMYWGASLATTAGRIELGRTRAHAAIAAAADPAAQVRARLALVEVERLASRPELAWAALDEAQAALAAWDVPPDEARSAAFRAQAQRVILQQRVSTAHEQGRLVEAQIWARALASDPAGDAPHTLALQGMVEAELGLLDDALGHLERALRASEGPLFTGHRLSTLGAVHWARGDHAAARTAWRESAALLRSIGAAEVVMPLVNLARADLHDGDAASASATLDAVDRIATNGMGGRVTGIVRALRAEARGALGDAQAARRAADEARPLLAGCADPLTEALGTVHLGAAHGHLGDLAAARAALAAAEAVVAEHDLPDSALLAVAVRALRRRVGRPQRRESGLRPEP